jgi:hypothetical protein
MGHVPLLFYVVPFYPLSRAPVKGGGPKNKSAD